MLLVRERPPLAVAGRITTPDGHVYRWATDEHKSYNAMTQASWQTTMPGGFSQCNITLPRNPSHHYSDAVRLSTLTLEGVGGRIAGEYRIDQIPSLSGSQEVINPSLVGWQAHLDDDQTAREIYLDCSLASWQGMSIQRQKNLITAGYAITDGSSASDPTSGAPAFITSITGAWATTAGSVGEGLYDAHGLAIGGLYYQWTAGFSWGGDTHWVWEPLLANDDQLSASDAPGNLAGAGPGGGYLAATTSTRKFAAVQHYYTAAGGGDGVDYPIYWTYLGVVGNHNLPLRGLLTAGGGIGLLSSDIEIHAVSTWAPKLSISTGPNGTVQPSSFGISQFSFVDPGGASTIIKAATAFEMRDWAVWEGPTYWSNDYGARGKQWQARVGPAGLQDTGPAVSRLFNGAVVIYTDVTGITRTVGPPGTNCNYTDAALLDSDPTNPANQLGIKRYGLLTMGTSTVAGAVQTGAIFLIYHKLHDRSGQAAIVGYVKDQAGNWWPGWAMRAGDSISFTDAADTSPRRIVSTSWDDTSKTNSIQLDAPPDGMTALLQRLSVSLASVGLS